MTPSGRAATPAQKRATVDRILAAWRTVPGLRLGQFILNATSPADPFSVEDEDLAEACETYAYPRRHDGATNDGGA